MNNGAFGENFPYSNFHDLNMDWIVKIAKDFLDQYTNIQNTITEGLEGLNSKAQELEDLLQQWYNTHSEDIAEQLANAISAIQAQLENAVADFNTRAEQKAEETIESIPANYTELSNRVTLLLQSLKLIVPAMPNNLKINITDTTVTIPAYTRFYYANNLIYRTQAETVIQRTAPSDGSPSEEYILFDADTNTFSSSAGYNQSLGANKYLLMTLSKGMNGSSLSEDFLTWDGGYKFLQTTSTPVSGTSIDLNTMISTGNYFIPVTVTTIDNSPFTITDKPAGAFVIQIFKIGNGAIIQNLMSANDSSIMFTRYKNESSVWTDWYNMYVPTPVNALSPFDFNSATATGKIYIAGWINTSAQNVPLNVTDFCILTIEKNSAGVIVQEAVYPINGKIFIRMKNTLNEWSEWKSITRPYYDSIRQGEIDLNTYTTEGEYCFNTLATFVNAPKYFHNCVSVYELKVYKFPPNNVLYQEFTDPLHGRRWVRYRAGNGTFDTWKNIGDRQLAVLFTNPLNKVLFTRSMTRKTIQDIAVYNGNIFEMDSGTIVINGTTAVSVSNGHGNTAMFGTTLHGDFPYLYIGSWTQNQCEIYVYQVTTTTATLVRTIQYPTLSGYLNMCVDETNDKIYILLCTSEQTSGGNVDFITSDLNGNIASRITLPYLIPVVQGMEYHNGNIYVAYGGLDNISSRLLIMETNGNLIETSEPIEVDEIEGISINNGTIYIADKTDIYF